jgi:multidrug efflux pump
MVFAPPAVVELGSAMGFDLELVDRSGQGHAALVEAGNRLVAAANAHPELRGVRTKGLADVEQYELDIDLAKAAAQGIQSGDIYRTVSAFWGGLYINDFMDKGRTKRVYLQADAPYRMQYTDFDRYHVRNAWGEMVPFSAFMRVNSSYGSPSLERYNGLPSMGILGEAAPGTTTGQAMVIMEELAKTHAPGFDCNWTGLSYEERISGSQAPLLYTLSLLAVFLCLAALYESWSIPFSVMLVMPLGVVGAFAGVSLRGMSNDVYFQVGLLAVIGLSAKNAILIVEFAKELTESGMDRVAATLQVAQLRLRPIVMTSMAFLLGVLPLTISNGAGSGSQNAIGTVVMAGVGTATLLGVFYTPLFFVLMGKVTALFPRTAPGRLSTVGKAE